MESDAGSPPPKIHFGERLRAARERAGLTQVQVAEKSGIAQNQLSQMENRPGVSFENFRRLARVLPELLTLLDDEGG